MAVTFVNNTPSFQANGVPFDSTSSLEVSTGAAATQVSPVNNQATQATGYTPNLSFLPASNTAVASTRADPDIEMVPVTQDPEAAAAAAAPDLEANHPEQENKTRWQLAKLFLQRDVWPFVKRLAGLLLGFVKWIAGILLGFFIKEELEDVFGGN